MEDRERQRDGEQAEADVERERGVCPLAVRCGKQRSGGE